jgi:hypothetical protein
MYIFSVDFESVDIYGDMWIAFAAIVMDTDTEQVVQQIHRYVPRDINVFSDMQMYFWFHQNLEAYTYMMKRCICGKNPIPLEIELANFARRMHTLYPDLIVIGDNPSFDYRLLNNILRDTRSLPMHYRNNYSYVPIRAVRSNANVFVEGIKHTPMHDVLKTCLSFSRQLRENKNKEKHATTTRTATCVTSECTRST